MDLVSQGKVDEINAKLNRGFDPNFNSVGKGGKDCRTEINA